MIYLSKAEILAINKKMTSEYGGLFLPPDNLLSEGSLDYLVDAVQTEYDGFVLYPEISQKAATYVFNIVSNHIFNDGNKRTGLMSALIFLGNNDAHLLQDVGDAELTQFGLSIASGQMSRGQVEEWFEERIEMHPIAE